MKRIYIIVSLIFALFNLNAQNNIDIRLSLGTPVQRITVQITNSNPHPIIIWGFVDYWGHGAYGGNPDSFIYATAHNPCTGRFIADSDRIFFYTDHLRPQRRLALRPGESFEYRIGLKGAGELALFRSEEVDLFTGCPIFCGEGSNAVLLNVHVHLKYMYIVDGEFAQNGNSNFFERTFSSPVTTCSTAPR